MALDPRHAAPVSDDAVVLSIPLMDCAAEESDIRHALDSVAGIRSLRFQLAQRTLTIDAPPQVMPAAIEAVNRAGYPAKVVKPEERLQEHAPGAHAHDHPHSHANSHSEGGGIARYGAALAFAVGAELLHFFAPDTLPWQLAGMALAAAAIGLAGFSTYAKGLAALRHGRLNINALMTVAVSGAFLIGQWPEAAMVMALYAIAEWIEARAVDRARNAIQGLLSLTPETVEVQQSDGA